MEQAKQMTRIAFEALDKKKAEDIRIIEVGGVSTIADYFIIANGTNTPHVEALVDIVKEELGRAGYEPRQIEGIHNTSWVLLDYNDIVIHIFSKEDRLFYDLERIWRDGSTITAEQL